MSKWSPSALLLSRGLDHGGDFADSGSRLCGHCRALFLNSSEILWSKFSKPDTKVQDSLVIREITRTRKSVCENAETCWICWHLWNAPTAELHTGPGLRERDSYNIQLRLYSTTYVLPLRYHMLQFLVDVRESVYIGVTVPAGDGASAFFLSSVDHSTVESNFDPQTVKELISTCKSQHTVCAQRKRETNSLPTRLLDVHTGQAQGTIYLCAGPTLASEEQKFVDYATLSYTWGFRHNAITTEATLKAHADGIEVQRLPKTYRDAVYVCQQVGVRYLWIDALCIVQAGDEKKKEIPRIREYFTNALFTISASGSRSVETGFLIPSIEPQSNPKKRHPDPYLTIPFLGPDGMKSIIRLESSPRTYEPCDEPINQRGWTLEERLLCPRVLIFPSTGGFIFQCNKTETYKGQIYFYPTRGIDSHMRLLRKDRPEPSRRASSIVYTKYGPLSMEEIHETWRSIVTDYGRRTLSESIDKLYAIAGLAEEYHLLCGTMLGTYLAGNWSEFLHGSLDWEVPLNRIRPRRPGYRGPSWSWVSVDQATYLSFSPAASFPYKSTILSKVIECDTNLERPGFPFGAVTGGHIRIEGPMKEVLWAHSNKTLKHMNIGVWNLGADTGSEEPPGAATADTIENQPAGVEQVYLFVLHEVCLMPGHSLLQGLILKRKGDTDGFERIGFLRRKATPTSRSLIAESDQVVTIY